MKKYDSVDVIFYTFSIAVLCAMIIPVCHG
jgi:hypothetical protein